MGGKGQGGEGKAPPVRLRRQGDLGIVTIDNPPVNALSAAVRSGLLAALADAAGDSRIKGVVLASEGKAFIAGADIREFNMPPRRPALPEVVAALDALEKPLVAAIQGATLGGGLEIALACHRRVAVKTAQFGFPEVRLGLLPGAGGTQRLPRVAGIPAALEIVTGGSPFSAVRAKELGVVDKLVAGTSPMRAAAAECRKLIAAGGRLPRISGLKTGISEKETAALVKECEQRFRSRQPGRIAPVHCARAVGAAALPFEKGIRRERELFRKLRRSPQRKALVHLFFAEREAAKTAPPPKERPPVSLAAVVGGGTMGAGIAVCFADAGIRTILLEADPKALEKGMERIRAVYAHREKTGRLSSQQAKAKLNLVNGGSYRDIADADVVVEAIPERLDLKREVLRQMDRHCKPGAVLATNTSSLDIDRMAGWTKRPTDVLGMHFFAPAQRMRLLEIVRARRTSPETLAATVQLAKRLGKAPVVVGVCPGFVGNRLYLQYGREAELLLEEGAAPQEVDAALKGFGMAMGPFEARDLSGIDNGINIRAEAWKDLPPKYPRPLVMEKLHRAGRLGRKNGAGYYRYEPESRSPLPDPDVDEIVKAASRERGIRRRRIDRNAILRRCLLALVNEGAKALEEGIAMRGGDIDVIYALGYGFPAHMGGPMHCADEIGLKEVCRDIRQFHRKHGPWWEPAPLLERLAKDGGRISEWKPKGS